jgi:hypothetical protein
MKTESMRIDITDTYCVIQDTEQYVLSKKGVNKNKDGDNFGGETLRAMGFFPSLSGAIRACIKLSMISDGEVVSLKEYIDRYDAMIEDFKLKI